MGKFKVALLQMTSHGADQEANLEKGIAFCRRAHDMGADLALFPEMWNTGYQGIDADDPDGRKELIGRAISLDDGFVLQHRQLAKELGMGIGLTFLEAFPELPRNSLAVIDKEGNICMTYAKVHTCDFGPLEACCTPGDDFYVCDFGLGDTALKLGAMICYDREAPESARILMLKGAEVVLTPNACGLDSLRIDQFKSRAYENAMGVAMTNYAAPQQNGHSVAFDADGSLIVEAGGAEGIFIAEFDLARIRTYREETVWGNAFRRPHRYGQLSAMDVDEVFLRNNAFGKKFERSER